MDLLGIVQAKEKYIVINIWLYEYRLMAKQSVYCEEAQMYPTTNNQMLHPKANVQIPSEITGISISIVIRNGKYQIKCFGLFGNSAPIFTPIWSPLIPTTSQPFFSHDTWKELGQTHVLSFVILFFCTEH